MADVRKELGKLGLPNPFLVVREAVELLRKRPAVSPVFDVKTPSLVNIIKAIAADESLPAGMFDRYISLKNARRTPGRKLPRVKLDGGAKIISEKPAFLRMGHAYTNLRAVVDEAQINLNVIEKEIGKRAINLELAGEVAEQKKRDEILSKLYK